jgi:hypothetical protein
LAKLDKAARKNIPAREFALPGRRYPIEDRAHARNALTRVSQKGTPAEKAAVRRAVGQAYPSLKQKSYASGWNRWRSEQHAGQVTGKSRFDRDLRNSIERSGIEKRAGKMLVGPSTK